MHHVDERTLLQIVHDATIMAPQKFLNVGVGGYSAPWSVWTLFKGELKFGNCGEHIGIKEAARVYIARHNYLLILSYFHSTFS